MSTTREQNISALDSLGNLVIVFVLLVHIVAISVRLGQVARSLEKIAATTEAKP